MFIESIQSVFGKISGLIPLQKGGDSSSEGMDFTSILSGIITGETGHVEGESLTPQDIQIHEKSGIAALPTAALQAKGSDKQVSAMMIIRTRDGKEVSLPVTVTVSPEGNISGLTIDEAVAESLDLRMQLDDVDSSDIQNIATALMNLQLSKPVQPAADESLRIDSMHVGTEDIPLVAPTNGADSPNAATAGSVHGGTFAVESLQEDVIARTEFADA